MIEYKYQRAGQRRQPPNQPSTTDPEALTREPPAQGWIFRNYAWPYTYITSTTHAKKGISNPAFMAFHSYYSFDLHKLWISETFQR
jgi:hypothetical protein